MLGDDRRMSGLRGRLFLHGGQSELHRFAIVARSSMCVLCAACGAMSYQSTAGATATSCTGAAIVLCVWRVV